MHDPFTVSGHIKNKPAHTFCMLQSARLEETATSTARAQLKFTTLDYYGITEAQAPYSSKD